MFQVDKDGGKALIDLEAMAGSTSIRLHRHIKEKSDD